MKQWKKNSLYLNPHNHRHPKDTHCWKVFFCSVQRRMHSIRCEFTEENWMVMVFRSVHPIHCCFISFTQKSLKSYILQWTKYKRKFTVWTSRSDGLSTTFRGKRSKHKKIVHQTLASFGKRWLNLEKVFIRSGSQLISS